MRIQSVELVLVKLRLRDRFETSFGAMSEREILLLKMVSDVGVGWSEFVADREPYYGAETVDTVRHIVRDYAMPALKDRDLSGGEEAHRLLKHIRGNNMARAGIEMGIWNLEALAKGISLSKLVGGTRAEVGVGVSVGIQESAGAMIDKISAYIDRGYQRIKVKIKPGKDVAIVDEIRARFSSVPLMVDANAAYTIADAERLASLDRHNLMMIEQPLDHDDLLDHSRLARAIRTPVCLDESIKNHTDCKLALHLGACAIINIKPGRVAGFTESRAIHDECQAASVPVWCGGMLESGVGRAYNVALASMPNFRLPGDISESARYWHEDIVEPEFVLQPGGVLNVPSGPGLGITVREDLIQKYADARERIV